MCAESRQNLGSALLQKTVPKAETVEEVNVVLSASYTIP